MLTRFLSPWILSPFSFLFYWTIFTKNTWLSWLESEEMDTFLFQHLHQDRSDDTGEDRCMTGAGFGRIWGTPRWDRQGGREGQQLGLSSFPLAWLSYAGRGMAFPSSSRILVDDLHVGRDKMGKILREVRWMESGTLRKWQSGQINHCDMQPCPVQKLRSSNSHWFKASCQLGHLSYHGISLTPVLAMSMFQIFLEITLSPPYFPCI